MTEMHLVLVILSLTAFILSTEEAVNGNCKQGWRRFEDKCYRVFTKNNDDIPDLNFDDATKYCQKENPGSTLVTIHSQKEQDFVTAELGETLFKAAVYIGLRKPSVSSRHQWIDGTKLDFEYWARGEPSNVHEDCVLMEINDTAAGHWNDIHCFYKREFICQSKPDPLITEPQPEIHRVQCPDKWIPYRRSCYSVFSDISSWPKAEETCVSQGSHLLSIQDGFENVFLKRLLDTQSRDYWIGLKINLTQPDDKKRQYLSWSDRRSVKFMEWDINEPKNLSQPEPQCVQLKNNLKWAMAGCQEMKPFICENDHCGEDQFKCKNGNCVSNSVICDRDNDCKDNSDESKDICNENRICPDDKFLCGSSGQCISLEYVCDYEQDCENGDDEDECSRSRCLDEDDLKCDNGKCVRNIYRCDGKDDCGDDTDEWQCEESSTLTSEEPEFNDTVMDSSTRTSEMPDLNATLIDNTGTSGCATSLSLIIEPIILCIYKGIYLYLFNII